MALPITERAPQGPGLPGGLPSDREFIRAMRDHALSCGGGFEERVLGLLQSPDLEQWSGLSRPSVSTLVDRFEAVLDAQDLSGEPVAARQARRWALRPDAGVVVAVEIGRGSARVAISDLYGRLEADQDQLSLGPARADVTLDWIVESIRRLAGDRPSDDVVGVCISLGAPIDRQKGVLRTPLSTRAAAPVDSVFAEWQLMRAREQLTSRLGWDDVTFLLDNDANLAALAEYIWGAGRWAASRAIRQDPPHENVLYVEWSQGIGAGLILNRRLYRGAGIAGEIGHTLVAPEIGARCRSCGKVGCLESAAGLDAVLKQLAAQLGHSGLSPQDLWEMAKPGHPNHRDVARSLQAAAELMARALGPVINLLNPQLVVIGGDVGRNAYDLIRQPLLQGLSDFAIHPALADVTVRQTKLGENGTLRGAIALVLVRQPGDPEALLTFLQRRAKRTRRG